MQLSIGVALYLYGYIYVETCRAEETAHILLSSGLALYLYVYRNISAEETVHMLLSSGLALDIY